MLKQVTPKDLNRWTTFLKWAHGNKYVTNLYRPKRGMYCDYRIRLFIAPGKLLEACTPTLDASIDEIKTKLLALKPS